MSFHYPVALYLFILGAAMVGLHFWSRWKRKMDIQSLGDWKIIRQLVPVEALVRRGIKDIWVLVAFLLLIFTTAGPQFGNRMKEVKQRGMDVFVAVDTSRSMLAEDVAPSRMDRAKQSLSLLIQKLGGNRVGIIAFAKFAVIQCPLTVDTEAARMFLDLLDTNTVPKQGTSLGDAIRLGIQSFNKEDKSGKAIVLLTDGEDHESDPMGAAKLAKENGVVIFTIGIGTTKGEVIKKRDENGNVQEFLKHKGEMVLSRLDDTLLSKIAATTGGRYYRASSSDQEIDEIADILNGLDKKEFATKLYERREERFQWFGWVAFLILLIEFFVSEKAGQWQRIRAIRFKQAVTAAVCLLFIGTAQADVKDHVRRGNQLLKKKDFAGARAEFESAAIDAPEAAFLPYNIATTYYLEGNFEEAKKRYEQALTMAKDPILKEQANYNLGHVMFHSGDKPGAIEKFKECLRINPSDEDAKYNIEYIRAGKSPKNPPQQKQNQQQQQQQQNQGGDKKPGDQKDQQGQQEEKKQNDQKDQEQKEKGDLSKEDADRVLQMMNDQEKEKQKDAKQMRMGQQKKDEKEDSNEDW